MHHSPPSSSPKSILPVGPALPSQSGSYDALPEPEDYYYDDDDANVGEGEGDASDHDESEYAVGDLMDHMSSDITHAIDDNDDDDDDDDDDGDEHILDHPTVVVHHHDDDDDADADMDDIKSDYQRQQQRPVVSDNVQQKEERGTLGIISGGGGGDGAAVDDKRRDWRMGNRIRERDQQRTDTPALVKGLDLDALRKRREELQQQQQLKSLHHQHQLSIAEDQEFEDAYVRKHASLRDEDKEEEEAAEMEHVEYVPMKEPVFKTHMARKVFRSVEEERRQRYSKALQDERAHRLARTYYVFSLDCPPKGAEEAKMVKQQENSSVPAVGGLTFNIKRATPQPFGLKAQHQQQQQKQRDDSDAALSKDLPQKRVRAKLVEKPKREYLSGMVPEDVMKQLQGVMEDFFSISKGSTRRHLRRKRKLQQQQQRDAIAQERQKQKAREQQLQQSAVPTQPFDADLDIFGDLSEDESQTSAEPATARHTSLETKAKSAAYFQHTISDVPSADRASERAENLLRDIESRERREEKLEAMGLSVRPKQETLDKTEYLTQIAEAKKKRAEIEEKYGSSAMHQIKKMQQGAQMFGDEDFGLAVSSMEFEDFEYDSDEEGVALEQLLAEKRQDAQALRGYAESVAKKDERFRSKPKKSSQDVSAEKKSGDAATKDRLRRAMKEGNEYVQVKSIMKRKFGTDLSKPSSTDGGSSSGSQSSASKKRRR